ncbi:L-glyceraldehyde 3-phosphate reductase [Raoultella planticola]|uniref:L-glyceraldehyde 3-phosphate reductase n=1 Tax=Raoultella planticola TaxID=575 RepID=A0A485BK83_RAOPL|nr:L-glyceraldehyde 3-phosphate reductase [Raoultella planticola]
MSWLADATRYDRMQYRYCGKSGLQLPLLSLGLWHNFSHGHALDDQRALLRKAFDLGITHFDLANNYGPPPGSAEEKFWPPAARGFCRLSRRADCGDESRLLHVARPLWQR